MRQKTRARVSLCAGTLAGVAAVALGGGAGASTGPEACSQSSRPICVTISDIDGVSRSTEANPRYTVYSATIRNAAGTRQTNLTVTLKLTDVVDEGGQPSTAAFQPFTASGCQVTAPDTIVCTIVKLPQGASVTFGSIFARTSTTPGATATRLAVTVSKQLESFTATEDTTYQADGDASSSIVFAGASTVLETGQDDGQFSSFPVNVPSSFEGFTLASLAELGPSDPGYFCPTEFSCFGQSVLTTAAGIFSGGNPANLVTTIDRELIPGTVKPLRIVVHHRYDDESVAQISSACSGGFRQVPPAEELPCRRIWFDNANGTIIVDAWDVQQGDWGFS